MLEDPELAKIVQKVAGPDLVMNKVPYEAKMEFVKLANDKFMGNYGVTLVWLMDVFKGWLPSPNEQAEARFAEIELRLDKLEAKPAEPEGRPIKNLRGETIGWKRS